MKYAGVECCTTGHEAKRTNVYDKCGHKGIQCTAMNYFLEKPLHRNRGRCDARVPVKPGTRSEVVPARIPGRTRDLAVNVELLVSALSLRSAM